MVPPIRDETRRGEFFLPSPPRGEGDRNRGLTPPARPPNDGYLQGRGWGMARRSAWLAGGMALLVAVTGCWPGFLRGPKPGKEGSPAPAVEGVDGTGQVMRLRDHKGKVVLLSFWHSHCPP